MSIEVRPWMLVVCADGLRLPLTLGVSAALEYSGLVHILIATKERDVESVGEAHGRASYSNCSLDCIASHSGRRQH